jgi:hypothetical protein
VSTLEKWLIGPVGRPADGIIDVVSQIAALMDVRQEFLLGELVISFVSVLAFFVACDIVYPVPSQYRLGRQVGGQRV